MLNTFCFGKNKYAVLIGKIIWDLKDWFAMRFLFADELLSKYLYIIIDFIITQEVTEQISFSRLYCERFWSKLPDIIWKIKILVISFLQISQDQIAWSEWLKGNYRATSITPVN